MKKSMKILSIIIILVIGLMLLPVKSYATGDVTVIPIENQNETTSIITSAESTSTSDTSGILAEDKIADDKVLPDAGFENKMVFIILSLVVFAVFAYVKVVKYNID